MKPSVKAGWIVTILAFTIIFSLFAADSGKWYTNKILVQEAVYEYVPSSQTEISACWIFATAVSVLLGIVLGSIIYMMLDTGETKQ